MYEGSIRGSRGAAAAGARLHLMQSRPAPETVEASRPRMDIKFPILGFLMEHEATGYDLRRRFLDPIGFFYRVSDGSIYPALKKLAREGLVTVRNEKHGHRTRKVYSISPEGRTWFKRMLRQPAEPVFVFDEMQIKVYFANNDPAAALSHINNTIREETVHASNLRALVTKMRREKASPFRRIVVELGQAVLEAKARVLTRLATELQNEIRSFAKKPQAGRTPRAAIAK
ncbi:MAG TPA: PadR family transcriptional regulator [Candidatus Binataceae bacterium]|nr:PadR family transcriptional regulator [Candidatus Binataceae bacterium]